MQLTIRFHRDTTSADVERFKDVQDDPGNTTTLLESAAEDFLHYLKLYVLDVDGVRDVELVEAKEDE